MTIKGRKQRNTIVLDVEPDLPDGAEVEVIVPATWQSEHEALLRIGCHPDFGTDVEQLRKAWTPQQF
jgi:hypothetical protein